MKTLYEVRKCELRQGYFEETDFYEDVIVSFETMEDAMIYIEEQLQSLRILQSFRLEKTCFDENEEVVSWKRINYFTNGNGCAQPFYKYEYFKRQD